MKTVFKVLLILALTSCQPYDTNASSSVGTPGAGTVVGTPPPIPAQEQPEVLNEGPMHEAFAQPVDLNAQPGIIAPNEPPPVIIENPSAERPKGTGYVWIPGYWGWSPESREYIWVSGCWRIPPANMSWVPGYWNKVDGGWQWIAGFWIPTAQASQIKYLPEPPELTDTEPPTTVTVGHFLFERTG
ncbi:MAG: YXWGXW repeat-containing protein [Sedimentisphaerales bacterium]